MAMATSRTEFQGTPHFLPALQQVEVAYFQFSNASTPLDPIDDTWTLISQQLVGSIEYDPLIAYSQDYTKCYKPDVVAAGDKFFVVWTREYDQDHDAPNQIDAPAVLECSWVVESGGNVNVYNDTTTLSNPEGRGAALDLDYFVRDCEGVADAVVLQQPALSDPKVAVIYPRQTEFGNYVPGAKRLFEIAVRTCTLNSTNKIEFQTTLPEILKNDAEYSGPLAPSGSALILPDAAPTIQEDAFWLTYEQQEAGSSANVGHMALEYWEYNGVLSKWILVGSKSVSNQSPLNTLHRRRPMISSLPRVGVNEEVSITYGKFEDPGGDTQVVYEQWQKLGGGLSPLPIPVGAAFPNSLTITDHRPSPVHGPDAPNYLRRCYFTRADDPSLGIDGVYRYEMETNSTTADLISDGAVGGGINGTTAATRAAADFGDVGSAQTVPVIWEDEVYSFGGTDYLRIILMIDG